MQGWTIAEPLMRMRFPQLRQFDSSPGVFLVSRNSFSSFLSRSSLWLLVLVILLPAFTMAELGKGELFPDRQLAQDRFEAAIVLRTKLESKPPRLRTISEYSRAIEKYRSVYSASPAFSKSNDALFAVGELYQMMGSDFKDPKYFQRAIKAYEFLIHEYPGSPYCPGATFASAEIYFADLHEAKSAEQAFREFLEKYPHSKRARNARARLEDLRTQLRQARENAKTEEKGTSPGSLKVPPNVVHHQGSEDAIKSENHEVGDERKSSSVTGSHRQQGSAQGSNLIASVKDVRYWSADGYVRIVVALDHKTSFIENHLGKPNRTVLDIENAVLPPHLVGQSYTPGGILERIRLGQPKKDIARLVVVGEAIKEHYVFGLEDPFRIVMDVRQEALPRLANNGSLPPMSGTVKKVGTPLPDELKFASKYDRKPRPSEDKLAEKTAAHKQTLESKPESAKAAPVRAPKEAQGAVVASGQFPALKTPKSSVSVGKDEEVAHSTLPVPNSDGTRSLIRTLGLKIGRLVIDPGHGGHDTGTVGPSGLMEKDLVLDIALKLKALLEDRLDGEVILTRTDDSFVPLERRTEIANENQADLFISIHANSSRDKGVRGIETFFLDFTSSPDNEEIASRENATSQKTIFELQDLVKKIALKEKIGESREFAQVVQKAILKQVQKTAPRNGDRGVKQAPFIVLIGAHMPSILTELSFLSNPSDEKLLKTPVYRQRIAQALFSGIENYTRDLGGVRTARKLP